MITINDLKTIQVPQLGDERGRLVVIEGGGAVPFDIKRVFYIYGSDEKVVRGQHANRVTDFCLINVSGTSKVRVVDGNENQYIISLDKPHYGVYLPHMLWKDMYDFSADSVLLVLASTHYDNSEYLRDYDAFIREARKSNE
jgi:dTDP-4-dehydrorhamnose 3,5-epimerase-like enzyme